MVTVWYNFDLLHRILNEISDAISFPVDRSQPSFNSVVELGQVWHDEGLLDRQQLVQHVVVHVHDQIEVTGPLAKGLNLSVQKTRWDSESQTESCDDDTNNLSDSTAD